MKRLKLNENLSAKLVCISGMLVSGYLIYLALTDKLTFYIHPDYKILATTMSSMLFGICILGLFFYKPHDHQITTRNLLTIVIPCLLVAIFGFSLQPTGLTSNTALRRGLDNDNVSFTKIGEDIANFSAFQDTRTFDISIWLKKFTVNPDPGFYKNQKVSVIGFVHRIDGEGQESFFISRYVITCCNIDARPVGILVLEKDQLKAQEGQWIQVDGSFDISEFNGNQVITIIPSGVKEVPKPNNPYIY